MSFFCHKNSRAVLSTAAVQIQTTVESSRQQVKLKKELVVVC